MKKILYILILLVVSCSKEQTTEPTTPSGTVEARIVTDPTSRAVVSGTSFATGSNVGVFLYKEDGTAHTTSSNENIKAYYTIISNVPQWVYYFSYSSSVYQSSITLDKDDGTAVCYAYYPYSTTGTDPEAISITMSNQYDFMYACNSSITMPDSDSDSDTDVKINLNFDHALSCINFNFQLENEGQNYVRLEGIQFNADKDIMTVGSFNLKTQTLTPTTETTTFSALSSSSYVTITDDLTYGFLVPPAENVAYTVYLTLNGIKMETPIDIPATTYTAGTSYTVNVTLGNYAKFTGILVDETWTQSSTDNEDTYLEHTI